MHLPDSLLIRPLGLLPYRLSAVCFIACLIPARQELKLAVAPDPSAPAKPAAENKFHHFRIAATAIHPR